MEVTKNGFKSRTLGTVYWIEAPGIFMFFVILGYGAWFLLKDNGVSLSMMRSVYYIFLGLGVVLSCSYIWGTSKNTSKYIYTLLAKASVITYLCLYLAIIVKGLM